MASVIIMLSDTEEDGGVSCHVQFTPEVTEESEITFAQSEGAFIVELLQRRASGQTMQQIAEEMEVEPVGGLEIINPTPEPQESN